MLTILKTELEGKVLKVMQLDFSGVEDFVPVGVGRYLAEVTKSASGISDRAQKSKWGMEFMVIEALDGSDEFVGKTIKWDVSLQPQALWKVMQNLQALGEDVTNEDGEFEFDAESYISRTVTILVNEQNDPVYGKRTRVNRLETAADFRVGEAVAA